MLKSLLTILIPITLISAGELHEYHVSITEIQLNKDKQRVELSMQLFVDDFEKALRIANKKVVIKDDLTDEKVWTVIQWYLEEHFSLTVNGSKLMLTYLGTEWDDDLHSFYVFIEGEVTDEISDISIYNSVFTEVSESQENMHHISIGTFKKSVLLVKDKEHASMSLVE